MQFFVLLGSEVNRGVQDNVVVPATILRSQNLVSWSEYCVIDIPQQNMFIIFLIHKHVYNLDSTMKGETRNKKKLTVLNMIAMGGKKRAF